MMLKLSATQFDLPDCSLAIVVLQGEPIWSSRDLVNYN